MGMMAVSYIGKRLGWQANAPYLNAR